LLVWVLLVWWWPPLRVEMEDPLVGAESQNTYQAMGYEGSKHIADEKSDELVTLDDGRVLPMKKTICVPKGNKKVPAGPRVKLTAKLREEAEHEEYLLRLAGQNDAHINMREQIDKGVNVNNRCRANGATAMLCAAMKGSHQCCKMLLDAGANPHLANVCMETPLSAAVQWGHLSVVELLLEAGVDPRQWNDAVVPRSPMDLAKEFERTDIEQVLIKYWVKYDERDEKKKTREEVAEKRKTDRHKTAVSAAAERKRQAEAGGNPLSTVKGLHVPRESAAVEVS